MRAILLPSDRWAKLSSTWRAEIQRSVSPATTEIRHVNKMADVRFRFYEDNGDFARIQEWLENVGEWKHARVEG